MLLCNNIVTMKDRLVKYVKEILGFDIVIRQLNSNIARKLPLYLKDEYLWYYVFLNNNPCLFALTEIHKGISLLDKQFQKVKEITGLPVVAVFDFLEPYNRKRLIEKKIAFIVAEKQLYIPDFAFDMREYSTKSQQRKETLNPIAQQILLLFLLDRNNRLEIESLPLKRLAKLFNTNRMAITRAVRSLKNQNLVEIIGDKEKTIRFMDAKVGLWKKAREQGILINPVMKKVFIDELPNNVSPIYTYDNALTEYTDINPARQIYYAIDKSVYQALVKTNVLVNENKYEGNICIEVWKYNPITINKLLNENSNVVDPLSLILCYDNTTDERVEMAMEQIEIEFIQ